MAMPGKKKKRSGRTVDDIFPKLHGAKLLYVQSHIDYVAEVIIEVFNNRNEIKGLAITEEPPMLRHFTARLKPVEQE